MDDGESLCSVSGNGQPQSRRRPSRGRLGPGCNKRTAELEEGDASKEERAEYWIGSARRRPCEDHKTTC